jgi:hypothetical protein
MSRKAAGWIPDEVINFFFNLPNPSSRNIAMGLTQSLTEISTRRSFWEGGKTRPALKANNLTAVWKLIV